MMSELRTVYMENNRKLRIDEKEVMRYLRMKKPEKNLETLFSECIDCVYDTAVPRAVYKKSYIKIFDRDVIEFDFMTVKSRSLSLNLKECKEAYIIAATIGVEIDRMIERYSRIFQAKAIVCDAAASAYTEAFCDYLNDFLTDGKISAPRFSAGYGDFSLEHQIEILKELEADKKIGLSITNSLMMVPVKSVSAIIGIKNKE